MLEMNAEFSPAVWSQIDEVTNCKQYLNEIRDLLMDFS
jgi:hypothetical protein